MKKLIILSLLPVSMFAAEPVKPSPAVPPTETHDLVKREPAPEAKEPTAEQKEIAQLKEQVAQLQKAVAALRQQRDTLAQQMLDIQVSQQLQEAKK